MNREVKIPVLYRDEMIARVSSVSQSPFKPELFINSIKDDKRFIIKSFEPFNKEDFMLAHTKEYVDGFFNGDEKYISSINIKWTKQYAKSVKYTNASLYEAIKTSIKSGLAISPVSGFHHATPKTGYDFCAFSGQVIASLKLYKEQGLKGCYIDLDAHHGNSIEDTYRFAPDLIKAIPKKLNINISGFDEKQYMMDLDKKLNIVYNALLNGEIHYVVLCHGADSIIGDELECGMLSPEAWVKTTDIISDALSGFPQTYCLFGGYRKNLQEIIDFHIKAIDKIYLNFKQ